MQRIQTDCIAREMRVLKTNCNSALPRSVKTASVSNMTRVCVLHAQNKPLLYLAITRQTRSLSHHGL